MKPTEEEIEKVAKEKVPPYLIERRQEVQATISSPPIYDDWNVRTRAGWIDGANWAIERMEADNPPIRYTTEEEIDAIAKMQIGFMFNDVINESLEEYYFKAGFKVAIERMEGENAKLQKEISIIRKKL